MSAVALKGLSADAIGDLLASSRTRNAYGPPLLEFMESDEAAVNIAEAWPTFAKKNPSTLYQGFMSAAKKAGIEKDIILKQVSGDDDNSGVVFLIHKERAHAAIAAAHADDDE